MDDLARASDVRKEAVPGTDAAARDQLEPPQ
jgi:hypothetical protein